jgi:cob(I)alamin adenosyltransferase
MAEEHEVTENVSAFVNRLSDYLFVLARKMNILADPDEIYWDKSCI